MAKLQKKDKKRLLKSTKPKTYEEWYGTWYKGLHYIGYIFLIASCVASYKFYEYLTGSIYGALALTVFQSALMSWLTNHCFDYYHQKKSKKKIPIDVFIVPLIVVLVLGGFADFKGSPELAHNFNPNKPVNAEAQAIQTKIDKIDSLKSKLLATYSWKGKTVEKIPLESKWHDTEADRAQMQQYDEEKNLLIEDKKTATGLYNNDLNDFNNKMNLSKDILKGTSIGFSIAYLLLQWWRYIFKYTLEDKERKRKKKAKKRKKKNDFDKNGNFTNDFKRELKEENVSIIENQNKQSNF